jgi:urea transport system ATP-binding protein
VTPDLFEDGAERLAAWQKKKAEQGAGSGDRGAAYGRVAKIGEPDFAHGVALYLEEISVSFDGFKALNKLSLTINVGELRCIIGPNGAGKTTMMDCITGKTKPDSGTCFFGSTIDLLRLTETDIAQIGVGRKFQKPTVYEQLSVFENLELALRYDRRVRASTFSRLTVEENLRMGLASQPSISKDIGRVIRMLADRKTMAIVLVEPFYDFAAELADQNLVMERGEIVQRGRGKDMEAEGVRQRMSI